MKKAKKLAAIACVLCGVILSVSACGGSGAESVLAELRTADSFSVMTNNTVIMQCEGTSLYWKYGESEYTEYYFNADSEGKKWVYSRDFNADKWIKTALPVSEYYSYLYMIKAGFGITDDNLFSLIDIISQDFSACTTKNADNYTLINDLYYGTITFWEEDGDFCFEFSYSGYTQSATIFDINKTKIDFPGSLESAEVGELSLP